MTSPSNPLPASRRQRPWRRDGLWREWLIGAYRWYQWIGVKGLELMGSIDASFTLLIVFDYLDGMRVACTCLLTEYLWAASGHGVRTLLGLLGSMGGKTLLSQILTISRQSSSSYDLRLDR